MATTGYPFRPKGPDGRSVKTARVSNITQAGMLAVIKGRVQFCRVYHPFDNEELAKRNQQQAQNNVNYKPKEGPLCVLEITDAQMVQPADPNMEQANRALFDCMQQDIFTSSADGSASPHYSAEWKTLYGARWAKLTADGKYDESFQPKGDLKKGVPVAIMRNTYKAANGMGMGVQMIYIMTEDDDIWYESGVSRETQSAFGFPVLGDTNLTQAVPPQGVQPPQGAQPQQGGQFPQGVRPPQGFQQPHQPDADGLNAMLGGQAQTPATAPASAPVPAQAYQQQPAQGFQQQPAQGFQQQPAQGYQQQPAQGYQQQPAQGFQQAPVQAQAPAPAPAQAPQQQPVQAPAQGSQQAPAQGAAPAQGTAPMSDEMMQMLGYPRN